MKLGGDEAYEDIWRIDECTYYISLYTFTNILQIKILKKFFPALLFYNHILYQTYKNLNTGKLSSLCYQIPNKNNYNNVILVYGFRGFITQLFGPIQPDRTS